MRRKRVTLSIPRESPTWDSEKKETWHVEFEKEPINDERWNCFVSAMVEAKAQDEEGLHFFQDSAAAGTRRAIKLITMADIINLLKGNDATNQEDKKNNNKNTKNEKSNKKISNMEPEKEESKSKTELEELKEKSLEFSMKRNIPIVELARQYALFTETECILPSDLMASVIKYIILCLKEENIFWKKVNMVRERKMRDARIKANFIKSQMPFVRSSSSPEMNEKRLPKKYEESIQDEPVGGPDLYIVLTEFYNPYYFTHLLKQNVPFVALFRIRNFREIVPQKISTGSLIGKGNTTARKKELISDFWERFVNNTSTTEYNSEFKNFLMLEYQLPFIRSLESRQQVNEVIVDEFAWILYYTYHVYRQHKCFLQELFVQRMVRSLEPLDLSKCRVYNKLCDILVMGMSNTIYLILYAIIEQIVAGIPYTEFVYEEYEPEFCDFFSSTSELDVVPGDVYKDSKGKTYVLVTPCLQCRDKKYIPPGFCRKDSAEESEKLTDVPNETTKAVKNFQTEEQSTESLLQKKLEKEEHFSETLLDEILNQKSRCEKSELKKNPNLCFYGDKFYLHTYQCDPRIIDPKVIMNRFLKDTDVTQLWSKFPELSAYDRAYYNHHFLRLEEICKISTDELKLKIAFMLCMKLLGISLSYFYKGEEDTKSEMFTLSYREKLRRLSRVRFEQRESFFYTKDNKIGFSFVLFKSLNPEYYHRTTRKIAPKMSRLERFKSSFLKPESAILKKVTSHFNLYFIAHRISGIHFPHPRSIDQSLLSSSFTSKERDKDKELAAFYSLIDCFDISNLSEPYLLNNKEDYIDLMKRFNFYESLEPAQMIQRILKAFDEFNTIQCSHYALTDNLFVIMYNDYDYRGIFYSYGISGLLTPVILRDFYNYLYSDLNDWLIVEQEEYDKFVNNIAKKNKALNEMEDEKYLNNLKKQFNAMSEEQKKEFLSLDFVSLVVNNQFEIEVKEEELRDLPIKPKFEYPNKISFVATNFSDVRVESHKKVQEFHSLDGTKVSIIVDSWLYNPYSVLTMSIKKSNLQFYYHNWLGKGNEVDSLFSLKTNSGIIFVFDKNEPVYSAPSSRSHSTDINSKSSAGTSSKSDYSAEDNCQYLVKISWPTGLMIQTIPLNDLNFYVKQSYIESYRQKKKAIQDESARCFVKNGQILLFKENGEVEVFCASGTKYILKEIAKNKKKSLENEYVSNEFSYSIPHYQYVTPVGEIWERHKTHCKKKLIEILKVYIGTDTKTTEIFYRREDGVNCMLWPNGKLVTSFPDGTKITSTPDFDEKEIEVDWSEEENFYFPEVETNPLEERGETFKEKNTLTQINPDFTSQSASSPGKAQKENFVSVSLTYLMEHPKYSTVFFDNENDFVEIKMPKDMSMKILPKNKFFIKQGKTDFIVKNDIVKFTTNCSSCSSKSTATITLKEKDTLCEFMDFIGNIFQVFRNGETMFQDYQDISDDVSEVSKRESSAKCKHVKHISEKQKCFVVERDFSGTEFLHNENFARQCFKLPDDTYYDLDSNPSNNCVKTHLFCIPYYKIGCDKWEMEYEDKNNALPTNLKKKDLKELDAKEIVKNRFKYPFPNSQFNHCDPICVEEGIKGQCAIPKFIVTRIIKCFSVSPKIIIDQLQRNVAVYQNKALRIYKQYKKRKLREEPPNDENLLIEDKLNQIALNLNQKQGLNSHLWRKPPESTRDLHYYKHNIELMEKLKEGIEFSPNDFLLCKYVQGSLPKLTNFDTIAEEMESEFSQDDHEERLQS